MPNQTLTLDPSVITVNNNRLTTTSTNVADIFGKRHNDVTRKIKTLECSNDFRCANFSAHLEVNPQNGEKYDTYQMTKDGFMFLVMGFTGKKAAQIKEAYINAFNAMATKLHLKPAALALLEQAKIHHREKFIVKKYALLNSMINHLDLPDDPVVIPATELINTMGFVRHIQQRANALHQACSNIDKCIDNLKAVTGRSLSC